MMGSLRLADRGIPARPCVSAVVNVVDDTQAWPGRAVEHDNLFFDGLWMIEDHHEKWITTAWVSIAHDTCVIVPATYVSWS